MIGFYEREKGRKKMTIEEQIGIKVKNLRNLNGLTQEELANRTELTKGFISQLERGLTAPSVSTLSDIVECLGTNLADFFHSENEEEIVFRNGDYFEKIDDNGNNTTWLVAPAQSRSLEPILVKIQPGQELPMDNPHEGEEFGYIMDGTVKLYYGEKVYTLKKGDSFSYKANRKHKLVSACKKTATVLWVSTPPSF